MSSFSSLSKGFSSDKVFPGGSCKDDSSEDTETGFAGADFRREDTVADDTFDLDNGWGGLKGGALRLEAGFVRFIVYRLL